MAQLLVHDRDFDPRHEEAVRLSPLVRRVTAPNAGPFTFHGTNSYLVGDRSLGVIDPGPDNDAHIDAIMRAAGDTPISHIIITHTHRDHSPGARILQQLTGAPIVGAGPHRAARPLNIDEINPLDASGDTEHVPDEELAHGALVKGEDWTLEAIATPGHTANHLAFVLEEEKLLFSGDHVMAWSTSIVAPPDGSMADFMASLETLIARDEKRYLPGHGGTIEEVDGYLQALKAHRLGREKSVLDRLATGDETIADMVATIYRDVPTVLHPAASLSLLAHVEDLVTRGIVACEGAPSLKGKYRLG